MLLGVQEDGTPCHGQWEVVGRFRADDAPAGRERERRRERVNEKGMIGEKLGEEARERERYRVREREKRERGDREKQRERAQARGGERERVRVCGDSIGGASLGPPAHLADIFYL
jgi:hypothetical protein